MTVEQLWAAMWPGVPFEEASLEDKKMMLAHAQSLQDYAEWRRVTGKGEMNYVQE